MKNAYQLLLSIICFVVFIAGCSKKPYASPESLALKQWPGSLTDDNFETYQLLLESHIAEGKMVFYLHESIHFPDGSLCATVTFLTPTFSGWTAQSSGGILGCHADYPNPEEFKAGFATGGNVTPVSSIFGFAPYGETVQVVWEDGEVSETMVQNGRFLYARPANLFAEELTLLDADGTVLETKDFCLDDGICRVD